MSNSIKTWDQAQEYCEALGAGLVKIDNPEENEFVLNLVTKQAPSLKQVCIGLKWSTNNFYWYDHSVPMYTNWEKNEPMGKGKNHVDRCGWIGTQTLFPSEQLVHEMILDVK